MIRLIIVLLIRLRFGFSLYLEFVNQLRLGRSRDCRGRTNAPRCDPFRCSSKCAGTTPPISPDRRGSGLHAKPLNAVIGRVFAPCRPRRTAGLHAKKGQKSTILVGHFAGPVGVPVHNQVHRPMEGVQGYHGSHWLTPPGNYGGRFIKTRHYFLFSFEFFHRRSAEKVA